MAGVADEKNSELRQCEDVLHRLEQKGVRWHLEDGSWW
jgi:hypothetical protein